MNRESYLSKKILTLGMITKTVKVTAKGQIAIPIEIRESAGIETGDELVILQEGSKILLEKPENLIKDEFKDLLKHSEKTAKKLWSNKKDEVWNKI